MKPEVDVIQAEEFVIVITSLVDKIVQLNYVTEIVQIKEHVLMEFANASKDLWDNIVIKKDVQMIAVDMENVIMDNVVVIIVTEVLIAHKNYAKMLAQKEDHVIKLTKEM